MELWHFIINASHKPIWVWALLAKLTSQIRYNKFLLTPVTTIHNRHCTTSISSSYTTISVLVNSSVWTGTDFSVKSWFRYCCLGSCAFTVPAPSVSVPTAGYQGFGTRFSGDCLHFSRFGSISVPFWIPDQVEPKALVSEAKLTGT